MIPLLLALSCSQPDAPEQMDGVRLLNRLSLDLRGVRPSDAEIARVEADPDAIDELTEEFLADPRFEARVRDLFAEVYLTRSDDFYVTAEAFGLDDEAGFLAAVGEEPLRIVGHVAANDLPWTDIVTADWTMADEQLAVAWPVDYPASGSGWQQVHYTDGRPAAGVLSTNGMWWRYVSVNANYNRSRANAISRILLCHDYLSRPISFDRSLNILDEDAVEEAVRTSPACVNCHASLDPLASFLFGFWFEPENPSDASTYAPQRERMWETTTGAEPSYFGEPAYTLEDLGHHIAADSRFPQCAVQQVYEGLLRRETTLDDADSLTLHREVFLADDLTMRSLIRSVTEDPRYRAASDADGGVPLKMVTPELLASQIDDLTGFVWTVEGFDMLGTDGVGVRTLAGGADGFTVTDSATAPNATIFLVQERLAELAASHVIEHDLDSEPRLFVHVELDEPHTEQADATVAQLQHLHLRLFGHRIDTDGPEVQANLELLDALQAVEQEPVAVWHGLLSALLRDPDLLFY